MGFNSGFKGLNASSRDMGKRGLVSSGSNHTLLAVLKEEKKFQCSKT